MYGVGFGIGAIGATTVLSGGIVNDGSFVITVDTTKSGTTASNQVNIPTSGAGYDVDVDWGDGSGLTYYSGTAPTMTKTYSSSGVYTVRFYPRTSGGLPRIYYNNAGDKLKLLSIEQWGNVYFTSLASGFWGCSNLVINATDFIKTDNLSSLQSAFYNCSSITSFNLSNANLSACTSFASTFYGCTSLTSLNMTGVTMRTAGTYSMQSFVYSCTSLSSITGFEALNLSKCSSFSSFNASGALTSMNLSGKDLSSCLSIASMFYNNTALTSADFSNCNFSSCTTIQQAFHIVPTLTYLNLSYCDFSHVTDCRNVVQRNTASANSIVIDISYCNFSSVTNFGQSSSTGMFYYAKASSIDMTGVTMPTVPFLAYGMFSTNGTFTLTGLSTADFSKATSMTWFLISSKIDTQELSDAYTYWASLDMVNSLSFHGGTSNYNSSGSSGRADLISTDLWTITDGGLV